MMSISLSATHALLDLMPGRAEPRKAARVAGTAPLRLHLLPAAWREALDHRARQRELEAAFSRLAETSPHLLKDAGLVGTGSAKVAPKAAWTRALPVPGADLAVPMADPGMAPGTRRRLLEMDDRLLKDVGITRAQAREEARRPRWDAPDAWLR